MAPIAPWWSIDSDDKCVARPDTISHLLSQIPYVPDHAATL